MGQSRDKNTINKFVPTPKSLQEALKTISILRKKLQLETKISNQREIHTKREIKNLRKSGFEPQIAFEAKLDDETKEILLSLGGAAQDIKASVSHTSAEMKDIMNQFISMGTTCATALQGGKDEFSSMLSKVPLFVIGTVGIYFGFQKNNKKIMAIGAVSLLTFSLTMQGPFRSNIQRSISRLQSFHEAETHDPGDIDSEDLSDLFEPQFSGDFAHELKQIVSDIGLAYFSMMAGCKAPSGSKITRFIDECSNWPRRCEGITVIAEKVLAIVEKMTNFVRTHCLGMDRIILTQCSEPKIAHWCEKVMTISNEYYEGKLLLNQSNGDRIQQLGNEGSQLIQIKFSNSVSAHIRSVIQYHQQILRRVSSVFESLNITHGGPRMEPLSVHFIGETGVGKSYATMPIINELVARTVPQDRLKDFARNPHDFIYTCNSRTKFKDGYTGQWVEVTDDIDMGRDVAGSETSAYHDHVQKMNIFPYQLNMADVSQKGNNYHASKILISSSNSKTVDPVSISYPDAYRRRFDFIWIIYPRDEYRLPTPNATHPSTYRLNIHHPDIEGVGFNKNIYWFEQAEYLPGGVLRYFGEKKSYDEAVQVMVARFQTKHAKSEMYSEYMREQVVELVSRGHSGEFIAQIDDDLSENALGSNPDDTESEEDIAVISQRLQALPIELQNEIAGYTEQAILRQNEELENDAHFAAMFGANFLDAPVEGSREHFENLCEASEWSPFDYLIAAETIRTYDFSMLSQCSTMELNYRFFKYYPATYAKALLSSNSTGPLRSIQSRHSVRDKFIVNYRRELYEASGITGKVIMRMSDSNKYLKKMYQILKQYISEKMDHLMNNTPFGRFIADFGRFSQGMNPFLMFFSATTVFFGGIAMRKTCDWARKQRSEKRDEIRKENKRKLNYSDDKEITKEQIEHFTRFVDFRDSTESQNQYTGSGRHHGGKTNRDRKANLRKRGMLRSQIESQSGDGNCQDIAVNTAKHNSYEFLVGENRHKFGSGIFLKERVFLFPAHYLGYLDFMLDEKTLSVDDPFYLVNEMKGREYQLKIGDLGKCRSTPTMNANDLLAVNLPVSVHMHPDITSKFATNEQIFGLSRIDVIHVNVKKTEIHLSAGYGWLGKEVQVHSDQVDFEIAKCWEYKIPTRRGDCGSLLYADEKKIGPGKIIGMHSAANLRTGIGISMVITKEDVDEFCGFFAPKIESQGSFDNIKSMLDLMPKSIQNARDFFSSRDESEFNFDVVEENIFIAQSDFPLVGNFKYIERLPNAVGSSSKTAIVKSVLYGKWGPTRFKPSQLSPFMDAAGSYIDPKKKAVEKFGKVSGEIDPELLSKACGVLYARLIRESYDSCPGGPRKLTFEESVLGIPDEVFCDSIKRNTSAGYPYVANPQRGYHGKEWFFGKGKEYDIDRPQCVELKHDVLHLELLAQQGSDLGVYAIDTLKDELLDVDKVKLGKTRVFSTCGLAFNLLGRMMFLKFFQWFMLNRISNGSAVGINCYSGEWNILALKLRRFGDFIIAGDYSGYDTSLLGSVLMAICDLINRWYDDGEINARCRRTIMSSLTSSVHIFGEWVYQMFIGQPSGGFGTTIFNTLYGELLIIMSYLSLHPLGYEVACVDIFENIFFSVYGDDNILNVSPRVVTWYNQSSMTESLAGLHMTYTDETKQESDSITEYRKLEDVTFLKRSFVYDPAIRRWIAPLELEKVLNIPYWTKEGVDSHSITVANVECAQRELSLHGKQTYEFWWGEIERYSRELLNFVPSETRWSKVYATTLEIKEVW